MTDLFYGEYQPSLDAKGRLIVPAKFRDGLGDKFIITKGLDGCLFVYDSEEWQRLEAKVKELPFTDKDVRAFTRFFFGGAVECETDKQGRVVIPQYLREFASLEKDVVAIGVMSRIELWSKDAYHEYTKDENAIPDVFAEKMAMLGI